MYFLFAIVETARRSALWFPRAWFPLLQHIESLPKRFNATKSCDAILTLPLAVTMGEPKKMDKTSSRRLNGSWICSFIRALSYLVIAVTLYTLYVGEDSRLVHFSLRSIMDKRTVFTTVTPLPPGITRESVRESLYDHVGMIDLNPLVVERHPIKPPATTAVEEYRCKWYQLTDKIHFLPNGIYSGRVTYRACFHDMSNGIQTHVYAPLGLDIKGKWTLGGSLPGEPRDVAELGLGVPEEGLWLREDVDMTCNILMVGFVKKNLMNAHSILIQRLVHKAHRMEAKALNQKLKEQSAGSAIARESLKRSLDISETGFGSVGSVGSMGIRESVCEACGAGRLNSRQSNQAIYQPWSPNSIKGLTYRGVEGTYQEQPESLSLQIPGSACRNHRNSGITDSKFSIYDQRDESESSAICFPTHNVSPYWNPQNRVSRLKSRTHPLGQNPFFQPHEVGKAVELEA